MYVAWCRLVSANTCSAAAGTLRSPARCSPLAARAPPARHLSVTQQVARRGGTARVDRFFFSFAQRLTCDDSYFPYCFISYDGFGLLNKQTQVAGCALFYLVLDYTPSVVLFLPVLCRLVRQHDERLRGAHPGRV